MSNFWNRLFPQPMPVPTMEEIEKAKAMMALPSVTPPLREFEIPEEKLIRYFELSEDARNNKENPLKTYLLWKFISELFPETYERNTSWVIVQEGIHIVVHEQKK